MNKTKVLNIPIGQLIPAEWNYKTEGTQAQIDKLCASIREDKSAGVIAVREIGEKYEVIDGNHRLTALRQLKWKKVPCENFGEITQAKAVIIARRRNHEWFQDDILKYAKLFEDIVLPEYSLDELENFMPESRADMENLSALLDFDWSTYEKGTGEPGEEPEILAINLRVTSDVFAMFEKWKVRVSEEHNFTSAERAFEYALIEALNTPEEERDREI